MNIYGMPGDSHKHHDSAWREGQTRSEAFLRRSLVSPRTTSKERRHHAGCSEIPQVMKAVLEQQ